MTRTHYKVRMADNGEDENGLITIWTKTWACNNCFERPPVQTLLIKYLFGIVRRVCKAIFEDPSPLFPKEADTILYLTLISEVNAGSFLISRLFMGPLSKCNTHGSSVLEESFSLRSCEKNNNNLLRFHVGSIASRCSVKWAPCSSPRRHGWTGRERAAEIEPRVRVQLEDF